MADVAMAVPKNDITLKNSNINVKKHSLYTSFIDSHIENSKN